MAWNKFSITNCIYCSEASSDRHHYKESVANSGRKRAYAAKRDTLPTCRECNRLLGSANPSFIDCCYILYDKVSHKHKNTLNIPEWDREDLDELSKTLRRKVLGGLRKKKFHMKRLDTLLKHAQSSLTYKEVRDIVIYGNKHEIQI
tara:strand:- start:308 stop:745 length:438 start_codon:yes stop_codon:yes gene_type:complete